MKNKYILPIITVTLITVQIWCFLITFKYPNIGIHVESNQKNEWIVTWLDKRSASAELGVKIGDMIKRVNNKSPNEFASIYRWRTIEQAHQLVISRNGYDREILINNLTNTSYGVFSLFSGVLVLSMAVLLFTKMANSQSARLLSFVFFAIGVIWISLGASVRGDVLGKILITSFMMGLPVIFYHFLVIFFKEKGDIALPTKVLRYLYALLLLGFGVRLLYFIPSLTYSVYRYNGFVTLLFFIVGFLLNIFTLTFLYFKYRKEKSYLSSIIKSVWFSLFVSFLPAIILSFIPRLVIGSFIVNDEYTSLFILFFPISFAYLIASNQLYDIGLVVRRFMSAGILALLPCSIFTCMYAAAFSQEADLKHLLFIFLSLLFLISIVLYSMEYFTTRFEEFLFPRKYVLQSALKKISKNLEKISSFRELKDIILVDIVDTLQVMGGAIVIQYQDHTEIIDEGVMNLDEIKLLVISHSLFNHPLYTCIEINRHEEHHSYLIMTKKKTNTLLGKEEIQWLNLIISYLAVSLENVHLIRKLTSRMQQLASQLPNEQAAGDIQWFRKLMFELQEEERIRIATDLHDTTMQDLFFLKRRFVALLEKYALNREDREQLNNIINFIELINTSLRQSCFELHPYLLQEIGLIQTIQKLVEKERFHSPFEIDLIIERVSAIEHSDLITKRHIFRIVQELLNNAKKHSQASKVIFKMVIDDDLFCLSYEDDGVGFGESGESNKEIGLSGIGMEQIKSRILHLNGQLDWKSSSGVRCRIIIPMKEVVSL
jgi:two-component system sensor histidine kinase ComP